MSSKLSTLTLVLLLVAAVSVAGVPLVGAQVLLNNGTVTLGVNNRSHLNILPATPTPSPVEGTNVVGLRHNATGYEALGHSGNGDPNSFGGACEGWGVGVANMGVSGWANQCWGDPGSGQPGPVENLRLDSFTYSPGDAPVTATSVTTIVDPANPSQDLLQVTHEWVPAPGDSRLYQANVTIRNTSDANVVGDQGNDATGGDIRYRRVMDWDAEPTAFEEYVTIGGLRPGLEPPYVRLTSDDGFETGDPLSFLDPANNQGLYPFGTPVDVFGDVQTTAGVSPVRPCGFTTDFVNCGLFQNPDPGGTPFPVVVDHGALFDFWFPALGPGAAHSFAIFYGAFENRAQAELAMYNVGAEVYSFANCQNDTPTGNPLCDPVAGTPVTFVFGTAGLGGNPAFGEIFGSTYIINGDATHTPLAGVTLSVVRTDPATPAVSRTLVSDASGNFDFAALPQGTYTVTAATVGGGAHLSTPSPLTFTIGAPVPCADQTTLCTYYEADFGYTTGSVAGTIYGDADGSLGLSAPDVTVGPVTVTLTGVDVNGPVNRTTGTAGDGSYTFSNLLSGTYLVSVPSPLYGLTTSTPDPVGAALGAGQNLTSVNIGYCLTTATSVVSGPNPSVFGDAVTFTATVTSPCGSTVSGGGVTFSEAGIDIVTIPLDASGHATTSTSDLASGNHLITATYVSGGLLQPSSGPVGQLVTPKPSLTTIASNHNPASASQAVTFTATVVDGHGVAISQGSVQFSDNGAPIGGPVSLDVNGLASVTTSALTLGAHPITAQYTSDTPDITGSSNSLTQTVDDSTTTSVTSSANPSTTGQSVTFTAAVTTGGGEAVNGGTVTFSEGSTVLAGPVALDGAGHASFATSTLSAGGHTITATYSGTGFLGGSSGNVLQTVNNPAVAESCFSFDFREVTYFKTSHVIMSSDATIRSHNGIGGGFNPAVWPYDPAGGTNKTVSRGTLFRLYGFAAGMIGHTIPNADNPAVTYTVQADPEIPNVNYIDLGGPARVLICPSQLQIKIIEGTPVKSWNLPGTVTLADVSKNIPGVMLSHNVDRIAVPARVRTELASLGTPLRNPNGTTATYGLIDYIAVQQWGHGNASFHEFVDLQMQFVSDDPNNRPLHYQVGYHTAKNRDFEGFTSCDYQDYNPSNDGVRMNDVWDGTNVSNPNWGPACGSLEPSVNQKQRENYVVPKNAVQILTTVNTADDTMRVFYGTIRPAGN